MKKYLIYILFPLFFGFSGCGEDPQPEEPFIDISDGGTDGGSGNPYWDWADKFPGTVNPNIERVFDREVVVRGGNGTIGYAPDRPVLISTGLYAPGDENIEVIVPDGVTDLHFQIGIGHELPDEQVKLRYKDVVTTGSLQPGSNTILSYFGGFLYFYYPPGTADRGEITVTVNGAVESYDFRNGETDVKEWLTVVQEQARILAENGDDQDATAFLNWVEMHGEHIILTMGIPEMSDVPNPETMMHLYDKIVQAYLWFGGYDPASHPPMRLYTDVQLPDPTQDASSPAIARYYYGGYPTGYVRGEDPTKFVDEKRLLNLNLLQVQTDGGFGNWFAGLYGFSETVMEQWQTPEFLLMPSYFMGYYHYARTLGLWPGKFIDFASTVENLNITVPFLDYVTHYVIYGKEEEEVRSTMLMQLAHYLGWGLFPYINEVSREYGFVNEYDQDAHDFFVMSVCEYAGENLLEFFRKWGFPFTQYAAAYCKNFPEASTEFWTSYDSSGEPSFVKRTPNRNFQRGEKPYLSWYGKDDWTLTAYVTHASTGDSLRTRTDNEKNAIDNDQDTYSNLGGNLLWQAGDSLSHVVLCTLEVGPEPIDINALSLWHYRISFVNRLHDIEYWDDTLQEWKPTVPNEMKMLRVTTNEFYYFEETYTTTKIRFYAQPRVNDWNSSDNRNMAVREIGLGVVRPRSE
ncbi:MAG: M60 family metallopeptidase [Alistipes sp.]|nr:M60 family metallopeptidase [Alistipes sp.]